MSLIITRSVLVNSDSRTRVRKFVKGMKIIALQEAFLISHVDKCQSKERKRRILNLRMNQRIYCNSIPCLRFIICSEQRSHLISLLRLSHGPKDSIVFLSSKLVYDFKITFSDKLRGSVLVRTLSVVLKGQRLRKEKSSPSGKTFNEYDRVCHTTPRAQK